VEDITSDAMLSRHQENMFIPWFNKILFRFSIQQIFKADHIITVSQTIIDSLIRHGYPKHKITTSFMPISDLFFSKLSTEDKKEIEKLKKEKGSSFWIFHPGNNDPAHKNIEHIFSCVRMLRDQGLNVTFVKAGDPFSTRQMNLMKKLDIQSSVIHKGMCSQETLRILYHACDTLLFPSYYEGCPAPPLEALASGLPIIVSSIPAHAIFKQCAFFTDPDNPKRTTTIIERLITKKALTSSMLSCGKKLARCMTWEKTINDTIDAYVSVKNGS
jgi:glycosyltransferase involved in cell wall biosynthesis